MANTPPTPVRTFKMFKEAFFLPKANPSLILSVFLISFLATYLYLAAFKLSTFSLLRDLTNKLTSFVTADPSSPTYFQLLAAILHDVKEITSVEVILFIIYMIISYLVKTVTVYALAMTHVKKLLTLKELLCNITGIMKGPIITQFLVSLPSFGYAVLQTVVVLLLWYISNGSTFLLILVVLLAFAADVWYLYLTILFSMSITVSVVEQGCYGVRAVARAMELIKGNKWAGVGIIIISIVVPIPIVAVYQTASAFIHLSLWSQLVVDLVYELAIEVLSLFILAAFTVYYYECRRSHGEVTPPDMIGKAFYTSLPTADAA
ncbi:hypothetical protein B296_00057656 [Ensete ventricosum]|uniref:Transmembrane protein n=1 Tax=Ensete ventricosum TaxID=4639 RepID=A0A426X1E4_ENSVE|nr:hypothetical protein B296_00057656 [Ensete ventricosum]